MTLKGLQGAYAALAPATHSAAREADPQAAEDLLAGALHSAVHLEMRDSYAVVGEAEEFEQFKRTGMHPDLDPEGEGWSGWVSMVRGAVARGVVVRRARIVSEPVTAYIRYEHAGTVVNLAAGERVRWLARRRASDLALSGNDFWLFDGQVVRFNHFTGEGASAGPETRDDVADAVKARLARSRVVRTGHHRFAILVEESVLYYRLGTAETMAEQLEHLRTAMAPPAVSLASSRSPRSAPCGRWRPSTSSTTPRPAWSRCPPG